MSGYTIRSYKDTYKVLELKETEGDSVTWCCGRSKESPSFASSLGWQWPMS